MAGAASQAGDADSSRAPGLTSGLQGSVNCLTSYSLYSIYKGRLYLACYPKIVYPPINIQFEI